MLFYCVILSAKHEMDYDEFMFFLTGGVGLENKLKNPASHWLSDKSWDEVCRMCDLPAFKSMLISSKSKSRLLLLNELILCPGRFQKAV